MSDFSVQSICGCVITVTEEDLSHLENESEKEGYLKSKLVDHMLREHWKKDVPLTPKDVLQLEKVIKRV